MLHVYQIFEKGGPLMWALLVCSVVSLTVTLERLVFFWIWKLRRDDDLIDEVFRLTEHGLYDAAIACKKKWIDWRVSVILSGLTHRSHGLSEAMEVAASDRIEDMKRGLGILDTIVTMAPLLGILGTVLGIIQSFDLLGASGIEDPKAVTGGIAQALITTAAGLAIALVTLVPLNYFISCVSRAATRIGAIATQFEVAYRKSQSTSDGS